MSDALLHADNLHYRAGGRMLIADVSLTLAPGEMVALIGPNGAGKSTLLRLLSGYLSPLQGRCRLQGREMAAWPAAQLARRRAVMAQQGSVAFPFRVSDVLAMARAPCALVRHARGELAFRGHDVNRLRNAGVARVSPVVRRRAAAGPAGNGAGAAVAAGRPGGLAVSG